jgi:hypothetical protein
MSKKYLKLSPSHGYDDWYVPLDEKENTWKEVLGHIESALDEQYEDTILGTKLEIEIVSELPEDIEF